MRDFFRGFWDLRATEMSGMWDLECWEWGNGARLSDFDQDLGIWDFLEKKWEKKRKEEGKNQEKWYLGGDLGLSDLEYLGKIPEGFSPPFFGS